MSFSRKLEEAWYQGALWLWLLLPLEWLFRLISSVRRALYRHALLPSYRAPVPLVVVGNITLGGTGKTPAVVALAKALTLQGLRVGIVSRGVGGDAGGFHHVSERSSATDCGDEAILLVKRTGCPCVVAKSRSLAIQELLGRHSLDIVLSDDGLQHYAMQRDLEIVLYDADSSFGNGRCLPMGPLREPLSRLHEADYVLAKRTTVKPIESGEPAGAADCLNVFASSLVNLKTAEEIELSPANIGRDVFAVSGIGRPASFHRLLKEIGFSAESHVFKDHHRFKQQNFEGLQQLPIIMTEKDAVKCRDLAHESMWYLKVESVLPEVVVTRVSALAKSGLHS